MRRTTLFKGVAVFSILILLLLSILLKIPKRKIVHHCAAEISEANRMRHEINLRVKDTSTDSTPYEKASNESGADLRECPETPPDLLGPINVSLEMPSFQEMASMFPRLMVGGRFRPQECKARHKVAIIIPYRNREKNLRVLLHNLHPILMRQQIDYGVYLVQQIDGITFNKARIMNIGFKEALKQYDYQCFVFHDADLIPEDDRNLYHCPPKGGPRHMSVAIDLYKYKLLYKSLVGGILALTKKQMIKVNGYSNEYWGWGGEDDDMYYRITYHGLNITRYPENVARYKMLNHVKDNRSPEAYKRLECRSHRLGWDGLINLKYQLLDIRTEKIFTRLLVNISREIHINIEATSGTSRSKTGTGLCLVMFLLLCIFNSNVLTY